MARPWGGTHYYTLLHWFDAPRIFSVNIHCIAAFTKEPELSSKRENDGLFRGLKNLAQNCSADWMVRACTFLHRPNNQNIFLPSNTPQQQCTITPSKHGSKRVRNRSWKVSEVGRERKARHLSGLLRGEVFCTFLLFQCLPPRCYHCNELVQQLYHQTKWHFKGLEWKGNNESHLCSSCIIVVEDWLVGYLQLQLACLQTLLYLMALRFNTPLLLSSQCDSPSIFFPFLVVRLSFLYQTCVTCPLSCVFVRSKLCVPATFFHCPPSPQHRCHPRTPSPPLHDILKNSHF